MSVTAAPFETAAVQLTALGYSVFPTAPADKQPLCRHGVHEATRDERQLLHWAERWPSANVGIALGPSDALALDIDPKAGASPRDVLPELELDERELVSVWTGEAPEPCAEHPDSLAGERGLHAWFAGAQPSVTRTRLVGVELRSVGLYCLAPGSRHPSGVLYEGVLPHARQLPPLPASVGELYRHGAENYGTGELVVPDDDEIIESPRHTALLGWAMSRVYARGTTDDAALAAMLAENERRVRPPLTPAEVKRLWRWADKSGLANRVRAEQAAHGGGGLWGAHGLRRAR